MKSWSHDLFFPYPSETSELIKYCLEHWSEVSKFIVKYLCLKENKHLVGIETKLSFSY